jgi:hypothetical protein
MPIDFPNSPSDGYIYPPENETSIEGRRWKWDATTGAWLNYAASQPYTLQIYNVVNLQPELDSKIEKQGADTTPVNTIRCVTQAEYDGLTKDANTIYFIKQ